MKLSSRDLVYNIKVRLKEIFMMHVRDQVLVLNGDILHNGRRFQYYVTSQKLCVKETCALKLLYTGPPRDPDKLSTYFVQIFVRTLTG